MSVLSAPLVCSFLLLGTALAAQQTTSSPFVSDRVWELGVWGGEAFGKSDGQAFGETHLSMAGFHAGRVIHQSEPASGYRRSLEYVVELQPLFLVTRTQAAYGGGFSPIGLTWNFAPRRNGRCRPYLEMNGGAMFTEKNVPAGRTDVFNFTASFGPGVMFAVNRTQALSVGLRYWHLSNANLGYANPAFNTVQLVVGYHWLLRGGGERMKQALSSPAGGNSGDSKTAADAR
jgi:hypothetical protein